VTEESLIKDFEIEVEQPQDMTTESLQQKQAADVLAKESMALQNRERIQRQQKQQELPNVKETPEQVANKMQKAQDNRKSLAAPDTTTTRSKFEEIRAEQHRKVTAKNITSGQLTNTRYCCEPSFGLEIFIKNWKLIRLAFLTFLFAYAGFKYGPGWAKWIFSFFISKRSGRKGKETIEPAEEDDDEE
jgi:actin-related protein